MHVIERENEKGGGGERKRDFRYRRIINDCVYKQYAIRRLRTHNTHTVYIRSCQTNNAYGNRVLQVHTLTRL